jgi:pimeloyl-[acyl-carrier protein] methyl ester esterase
MSESKQLVWVLLPGLDGTGALFAGLLSSLSKAYPVVIIRYPPSKLLAVPELLQHIIESLPDADNFMLLAESFSGPLAIEIAAAKPSRLRALVLCNTFFACPLSSGRMLLWLMKFGLLPLRPPRWAVRRYLLGADAPRDLIAAFYDAIDSSDPATLLHRIEIVLRCDVGQLLRQMTVPTLCLSSAHDRIVKQNSVGELAGKYSFIDVVELNGPHLLLQRQPEEALHAILRFIRKAVNESEFA